MICPTFSLGNGWALGSGDSIKVIFGYQHLMVEGLMTHDTVNVNGPSALMYAWMGPFIGALIRPVGGWISDKIGGALVTQVCSVVMVGSALGVAYFMKAAYNSATPEEFFVPFFLLFLLLFAATGIGNGSTFRTIAMVFPKEQAGPVLGWTSAVAAYGAFYIPKVLGEQIKATTPENALFGAELKAVVEGAISDLPDDFPDFNNLIRIKPGCGFIKYQYFRVIHHCMCQSDPLFISF